MTEGGRVTEGERVTEDGRVREGGRVTERGRVTEGGTGQQCVFLPPRGENLCYEYSIFNPGYV